MNGQRALSARIILLHHGRRHRRRERVCCDFILEMPKKFDCLLSPLGSCGLWLGWVVYVFRRCVVVWSGSTSLGLNLVLDTESLVLQACGSADCPFHHSDRLAENINYLQQD